MKLSNVFFSIVAIQAQNTPSKPRPSGLGGNWSMMRRNAFQLATMQKLANYWANGKRFVYQTPQKARIT